MGLADVSRVDVASNGDEIATRVKALLEERLSVMTGVSGIGRVAFRMLNDNFVLQVHFSPQAWVAFTRALEADMADADLQAVLGAVEEAGRELSEEIYGPSDKTGA